MWKIVFTKQAQEDVKKLKTSELDKKVKELIEVVKQDPFSPRPAYEKLVGNLSGVYSRRINRQHRFVYQVLENGAQDYRGTVKVLSMWTHYE